jgi:hypothetical protein
VAQLPETQPEDAPIDHLELVTLLEVENPIRLALIRSVLEVEGIECIVLGESPHTLGGIAFTTRRKKSVLQIAKQDEERAREVVDALELPEENLQPEE